jgi:hypothetical protein
MSGAISCLQLKSFNIPPTVTISTCKMDNDHYSDKSHRCICHLIQDLSSRFGYAAALAVRDEETKRCQKP